MFPVWHLENVNPSSVNLYKSDETHFIVTQDGDWTPVISCGLFVIINQQLLSFFQHNLDTSVHSVPVSIYDRVLEKYFVGHSRIFIKSKISPEDIDTVDHLGRKIWYHESSGGIFISSDLKNRLEYADIQGLQTSPGFSRFAGN